MAIVDVKSGDTVYYNQCNVINFEAKTTVKPVVVNEVFRTFVTVHGFGGDRFRYPGGGLIGNGWGEHLTLEDNSEYHSTR